MKYDEDMMIKDDLNFLENPNWVVSKREAIKEICITKENSLYELKSTENLPVRFDKIVLYYLIYKISKESDLNYNTSIITRYEIAKNVFSQEKNFSKAKYDRIMLALKRWQALVIHFNGNFLKDDGRVEEKKFSVIDSYSSDKKTKKIKIKFNSLYIRQLKETTKYNSINFVVYKKLARPVSMRLYELSLKTLTPHSVWLVYMDQLADALTLGKRAFPSQVLLLLKPAILEINKKAHVNLRFIYDQETGICIFKKVIRF